MSKKISSMTIPDFWDITLKWIYGIGIVSNENELIEIFETSISHTITKSSLDRWKKGISIPRRSNLNFEIIVKFMTFFYHYDHGKNNYIDAYNRLILLFKYLSENKNNYDCSAYEKKVSEIHESEPDKEKSLQKYHEIFEQAVSEMATAVLSQTKKKGKKQSSMHDIKIQMNNFRTYCIGEALSNGCSASYENHTKSVFMHYDFCKTPADICSVVFFTPNIDLSMYNDSYLSFTMKSDIEVQCIIEIRGASVAGSNPDNQLYISAHIEPTEYKISLNDFVGTKDYSCISEVKIICTRSDVAKINLEVEDIRFINN